MDKVAIAKKLEKEGSVISERHSKIIFEDFNAVEQDWWNHFWMLYGFSGENGISFTDLIAYMRYHFLAFPTTAETDNFIVYVSVLQSRIRKWKESKMDNKKSQSIRGGGASGRSR